MSTSRNNVRPLGIYERAFQVIHDIDHYYSAGLTFRYKIPINLSFTSSSIPDETKKIILRVLYPTLEQTILKEPSLAVCFADLNTSKPLFVRLSEIDLSKIIKFVIVNDDNDITEMFEEEHNKKFNVEDNSIPLWRVVVGIKKSSDESSNWNMIISLIGHHSILDGKCFFAYHSTFNKSLLEISSKYNSLKNSSFNELKSKIILPQQSTKPFGKPIEEYFDTSSELFEKKFLPKTFKKKLLKGCWLGDVPTFSLPRSTRILLYTLTAEEINSLRRQSKQHETSITSMFNTSVLFSAYHHLILASNQDNNISSNAKELAPFDTIKLSTLINLRPYATPEIPPTQTGVYVSYDCLNYKYPKPDINKDSHPELDFWRMSREFKEQLTNSGISKSIKNLEKFVKLFPNNQKDIENFFKGTINDGIMGREHSIMVTSIGNIPKISPSNLGDNEWKMNDILISTSYQPFIGDVSPTIIICTASYENNLNFILSYQTDSVNHKKVVNFGEGIVKCLKFVAKNKNVTLQDLVEKHIDIYRARAKV